VFYSNNGAREAFVELCRSKYVQQVTFDSYLYKKVQGNDIISDIGLLGDTIKCLIKVSPRAPAPPAPPPLNPPPSLPSSLPSRATPWPSPMPSSTTRWSP
jgi:geranylgeranyl reductase